MEPALKSRREEYSEATRRALLDSAAVLFGDRGFAGTSLDEVAARARVTKGAVYHHFPSKAALFEAVCDEAEQQSCTAILAATTAHASAWEGAIAGLDCFLDQCLDSRYRQLCIQDAPAVLGFLRWWENGERYEMGLIRSMLAALAEEGLVEVTDLDSLAHLLYGATAAAALALARSEDIEAARGRLREVLMRLVWGLRPFAGRGDWVAVAESTPLAT